MSERISSHNINFDQNPEYMVFHNIERHVRHRRALAQWPLHITVVPPFRIPKGNVMMLRDLVREVAWGNEPILLNPGEDAKFGPNNDVAVTKVIDPNNKLHDLHMRFMWDLGSIGCDEVDATYAYDNYSPHFTWKRGVFPPTSSFALDTLSIVRRTRGAKTVLETTRLEYC